jgi:hypothetical protein
MCRTLSTAKLTCGLDASTSLDSGRISHHPYKVLNCTEPAGGGSSTLGIGRGSPITTIW